MFQIKSETVIHEAQDVHTCDIALAASWLMLIRLAAPSRALLIPW